MLRYFRPHQSGVSLIELMVTVTIGLLITALVTALIARTSASRGELEKLNRQIENGRYAYEVLADDLRHAGYYGLYVAPKVSPAPSVPDACSTDLSAMLNSLSFPIQGISDYGSGNAESVRSALYSCLPAAAIKTGTDVIAVRRVATTFSTLSTTGVASPALTNNRPYLQSGMVPDVSAPGKYTTGAIIAPPPSSGLLSVFYAKVKDAGTGASAASPPTFTTPAAVRPFIVRIYFVSPCSEPVFSCASGSSTPALKRIEITAGTGGPAFPSAPEVIAEGIEDLQVDYGINNTGSSQGTTANYFDGSANTFVQCQPLSSSTYETNCLWQDVVSVKLHILARNIDPTADYVDNRQYDMGLKGVVPAAASGYQDHYKRHAYSGLVRLNNVAMNRECTPVSTDPCS